jgi:hypothetical protein
MLLVQVVSALCLTKKQILYLLAQCSNILQNVQKSSFLKAKKHAFLLSFWPFLKCCSLFSGLVKVQSHKIYADGCYNAV